MDKKNGSRFWGLPTVHLESASQILNVLILDYSFCILDYTSHVCTTRLHLMQNIAKHVVKLFSLHQLFLAIETTCLKHDFLMLPPPRSLHICYKLAGACRCSYHNSLHKCSAISGFRRCCCLDSLYSSFSPAGVDKCRYLRKVYMSLSSAIPLLPQSRCKLHLH